jgi:RNA polymerase sigma-70 factor (ECF subfamily)
MTERSRSTAGATSAEEASDEVLLAWVAAGQQAAVAQLYDRYQGSLYGMATRITGDRALAEDVVQDAFLGIWRNASRFRPERASARTWILAITHHRAVDAVRRRRPASELPDPDVAPPRALIAPDVWPEVALRLEGDAVRTALAALPAPQREAIELAYFSGLTQHEIAARTDAPLGTVKSRVRLGLIQLRRSLGEPEGEAAGAGASPTVGAPGTVVPGPDA